MVSQVDVLSDREKEILSNYDRLDFECACSCSTSAFGLDLLIELMSRFFSRLYGFLRIQDPIGDPSLPDLNHKSLLLKVRMKVCKL